MKRKSTKTALLMSFTSLLLCCAMLIGTTFAWFTDSVTSGVNRIVAGNLDIEVTHTNAKATTPTTIAGEKKMFVDKDGNAMLWEPGAVSYENFTVANVGTLALKYKINMNVADYNAVSDTSDTLKDAIKIMVLRGDDALTTVNRDSVLGLNWSSAKSIEEFEMDGEGDLYPEGTEGKKSSESFQLIAYWQPTDNDNKWNVNNGKTTTDGQPLFIDFGVNVIATQLEHEFDSFGNDYDHVDLPALPQSINKTFESAKITTMLNDQGKVVSTAADGTTLSSGTDTVEVVNKSTNTGVGTVTKASVDSVVEAMVQKVGVDNIKTVDSNQDSIIYIDVKTTVEPTETGAEYDITLSAKMEYTDKATDESKTAEIPELTEQDLGGKIVVVTLDLGKDLKNVKVAHKGKDMAKLATADADQEGFFYDKTTGKLIIKSKSFSPFQVSYDNVKSVDLPMAYVTAYDKDHEVPKNVLTEATFPFEYKPFDLSSFFGITSSAVSLPDTATLDQIFLFDAFKDDDDAAAMKTLFEKLGLSSSDTDQLIKSTLEDTEKVNKAIAELNPETQERVRNIIETRKDYLGYIADFTIEFDKDVAANSVSLWGNYPSYGALGFYSPIAIEKGEVVPLLGSMYEATNKSNPVFNMNYLTICGYVRQFACGISNLSEQNIDTTATVSLKLFPVGEDGNRIEGAPGETVCSINYTFDKVNVPESYKTE